MEKLAFHRERGSSPHILYQIGRQQQRPLVGRDHECRILQQMLLETEQPAPETSNENPMSTTLSWASPPRSSCVLLHGEPGIGKTRLAEEVGRAARERNWSVIWSSAYSQESSNTYRLWSVAIRNAIEQG
ncbi:MAG TPA: ATP-binding protein, partial [Ktedonobacteraceae bacterium]|nr:ATP-binding protein [Ktedonobacteraceae bacterium]